MWFVLIISLQVGTVEGDVAVFEDVQIRFKSMASCRYIANKIGGAVRIKQPCAPVADM